MLFGNSFPNRVLHLLQGFSSIFSPRYDHHLSNQISNDQSKKSTHQPFTSTTCSSHMMDKGY
ncbi:hypothetical protein CW304_16820 [Bacillus sp. UFRGS-B20]|nr:hypothetical protein CW304_16820 [Bacillus sp. UFRGS-B20]